MSVQWSKFESGAAAEGGAGMEQLPETLHDHVTGLYEAMREKIFRYLLILGIEPDQAQEICQETFLRLYAKLREGEKIENVHAWIFVVARNCGLNARQYNRKLESFDADLESNTAASRPTPEQELLGKEKFQRLREAVAALSPQQQHCLHLRADGLRYREIAQIVGVRTSTVGEFLRRAVNRLREALYE
jgi:RNA polymerase sigma-70 factor (ECF subfamily)